MIATVLMVAEKPSLASSIAQHLSNGTSRHTKRIMDVHEWNGTFEGQSARFKMTSVIGHVFSIDFPKEYNNWDKVDPSQVMLLLLPE